MHSTIDIQKKRDQGLGIVKLFLPKDWGQRGCLGLDSTLLICNFFRDV